MSTSKTTGPRDFSEDAYHHGDLRRALLDAATAIVEAEGHHALTLREAARRAGVSHNAPYRHFESVEALAAAVAAAGFESLAETLQPIARDKAMARIERKLALGRAYLDFALAHPRLYQLMFSGISHRAHPDLDDAATGAFEALSSAVDFERRSFGVEGLAVLAGAHGLATLILVGFLSGEEPEIEEVLSGSMG